MQIAFILLIFILSGCSTHMTTLKQDENFIIYELPEDKIFQIVYQEMHKIVDDEIINEMDGPERGFFTRLTFGPDWYDVKVKIVPVEGQDGAGRMVRGYFVELGGKGTYPTNRSEQISKNILGRLNETKTAVQVTSFKKVDYSRDRDRWRVVMPLPQPGNLPIRPPLRNVYDDLRELKKLSDEGIITQEEYEQREKDIIAKDRVIYKVGNRERTGKAHGNSGGKCIPPYSVIIRLELSSPIPLLGGKVW